MLKLSVSKIILKGKYDFFIKSIKELNCFFDGKYRDVLFLKGICPISGFEREIIIKKSESSRIVSFD